MTSNSLLDFRNFEYIINNDICKGNVHILILVHTAPNHFHHRNVIRSTWGNLEPEFPVIKIVFLLAATEEFQANIERENYSYRDIVQGNFLDSYRNLTYKHVMGLSWASENCAHAKYLLKMDDDIFMDVYQLLDYIYAKFKYFDLENNIACYFQKHMPVVRDPVSKWYVSKAEFSSDTFDDYCSGWAYLTTPHAAKSLIYSARKLPYFWVDDVHLTGSAAKGAGIGKISLNYLYALETDGLIEWVSNSNGLKWDKVFAPTWGDLILTRKAHEKAKQCYISKCKCCYARKTTLRPTTVSTTAKGVAILLHAL
ncbi:UDP-GlcNAc:betaGal beta-1,3-N-acetylglucosaminyltransferase 5A, partial [Stegodyphus mimosarum]